MTDAKISQEPLWYEAKELMDDKESGNAYEGLFELNLTGFAGDPLITRKRFKPVHYTAQSKRHIETVPIFNESDICSTKYPTHLKDQFADALLRMQAKVDLIEKRLNILQDSLERLCTSKDHKVSHGEPELDGKPARWMSDSKVFWFVWPIVTQFIFAR